MDFGRFPLLGLALLLAGVAIAEGPAPPESVDLLWVWTDHYRTPRDYIVDKFADHDWVVLGEYHRIRATLRYHGEVLHLDDSLGVLLGVLDARGLKERTLVVLTGDHGEALGEHDWLGHTVHLYEEQIRVPLILRWPETLAAGHQVKTPLGLVDVAPTIAELVGIDLRGPVDGRSIAGALRDRVEPEARPVMGLRRQLFQLKVPYMGERHYVRAARWKYIRGTDGPQELYDLDSDPLELTNRTTEHPDVVARLSVLLDDQQARSAPPLTPELSAEEIEALRALGYTE